VQLFTIDFIIMFVGLPGVLIYDQWTRVGRVGWEWVAFGLWAMSLYGALLNDWLLPSFAQDFRNLPLVAHLVFGRLAVLSGVGAFLIFPRVTEEPSISEPTGWKSLRASAALIALALFVISMRLSSGGIFAALTVSFVAFVVSQARIVAGRELDVERVLRTALQQLHSEDDDKRRWAVERLAKVAKASAEARVAILEALADKSDSVAFFAMVTVRRRFGEHAIAAVPRIIPLLNASSSVTRSTARKELTHLCGKDLGEEGSKWLEFWRAEGYEEETSARPE